MWLGCQALKFPRLAGNKIVKILVDNFDFQVSRQRGSHVVLYRFLKGRKIVTVVPLHKEVRVGTIFGVLSLAEIKKEDFLKKL